jgi:PKD repeat protein
MGTAYSGKIGQPILFDASGSYDPSGLPITRYDWDFDGDGVFDLQTTNATVAHTYTAAFEDYVVVRVTGQGGTALASALTVVNAEGYVSQGDEAPCPLDENGFSIIVGDDGQFLRCTPTNLPDTDQPGVAETSNGSGGTYIFGGFLPPVQAPPQWNTIQAGRAVPIKFSLNGDYGLSIVAEGYPKMQTVSCSNGTPQGEAQPTVSASSNGLSYDLASDTYTYVWKTERAWRNRCLQFQLRLTDGQEQVANFRTR